ncbi:l-ascorbic acid binding protein [Apiospora aurea]|uniref:L-ascorbic acid binding protein n=1 Tax=Apiospora aurea TaxID=335848 RepID=A0ABR1QCR0_9PEZI
MASQAAPLQRFKAAMGKVYGSFESFANWRVPPLPCNAGHRGRYLWTDAFGVVNFVTLRYATGEERYLGAAKRLVQTVHDTLGRTRDGSSRLPGASDAEPLKGGLRIGKVDEAGSDGDGQYHHYLTLWVYALSCLAVASKEVRYNDLAIQLAQAIHPRFIAEKNGIGGLSMVWKISTDMSRPLSRSKGHLDDVTGYVVFERLDSVARWFGQGDDQPLLAEKEQYWSMTMRSRPLQSSTDMLDLGMSLWVAQFCSRRGDEPLRELGTHGINTAREMLVERKGPYSILTKSAGRRLAFRELGACLGIKCYSNDADLLNSADLLVEFWGSHAEESTPDDLVAITQAMLAAALIPGAFDLSYPDGRRLGRS